MLNPWLSELQEKGVRLSIKVKKILVKKKSKYQLIEIFDTASHGRVMLLDKKIMLTEKDEFVYHEMICHIPLFQIDSPKKVLIIGGGDGGSVRECLKHPSVEVVHLCEIDGDVIDLSKKFLHFTASDLTDKRVSIFVEDGFKFLKGHNRKAQYDLVIVDSTDPVGFAAKLFETDFFKIVKNVLKKNGIICCQCESPFFFSDTISNTHNRLAKIFKHVSHYTAPVSTYPSGYWSFAIASDKKNRISEKNYKSNYVRNKFRFYNKNIHKGSFCLPNFFEDLIDVTQKRKS